MIRIDGEPLGLPRTVNNLRLLWRRSACTLLIGCAGLCGMVSPSQAQDNSPCGSLANGNGPWDYRAERGRNLSIVESFHFTPSVEMLQSGKSGTLGQDIDYTLRAFPNHHRALLSVMNYGDKVKSPMPPGTKYSVECYFVRALTFQPDDVVARMLYAKYLATKDRKSDALKQLEVTAHHAQDYGFTYYNMGLLYMELGEPQLALRMAHRAEELGFLRPELKKLLDAAGHWREPAPAAAPASAASKP